jgi:hypothetical protein
MNHLDLEAIELGKQLSIEVYSIEELDSKLAEMDLVLGLDMDGSWVVLNSENEILAKVE